MKGFPSRYLWAFVFLLTIAAPLAAQETLELKRAIGYALQNNSTVRSQLLMEDSASLLRESADKVYLPRLSLMEAYQRTDNPPMAFAHKLSQRRFGPSDFQIHRLNYPDPIGNWHTELRLEQPVFNQGKEIVERKRGRVFEGLAGLKVRYSKEAVAFEVARVYLQILTLAQEIEVLKKGLKEAEEGERLASERYKVGSGLYSDLLNGLTRKEGIKTRLTNLEAQYGDLVRRLNHLMGQDLNSQWSFREVECIPEPQDLTKTGIDTLIEHGRSHRSDVLIEEAELSMEALNKDAKSYAFYPSLNLYGSYAWDTNEFSSSPNSYEVGFVINWNLFNGLSDTLALKAAQKALEAKEISLEEKRGRVEVELKEAWNQLLASLNEYGVSGTDVRRAEEALRIIKARYKEGLALFIELLNAQVSLEESLLRRARNYYSSKLLYLRLQLLSGKLLEVWSGCEKG